MTGWSGWICNYTPTDGEDDAPESEAVCVGNAEPRFVSALGALSSNGVLGYTLEVEDADGDRSLRYRLVTGPSGMELDPILGRLTSEPDLSQVGTHAVEVAPDDRHGREARQVFELTIREVDESGQLIEPADASADPSPASPERAER